VLNNPIAFPVGDVKHAFLLQVSATLSSAELSVLFAYPPFIGGVTRLAWQPGVTACYFHHCAML